MGPSCGYEGCSHTSWLKLLEEHGVQYVALSTDRDRGLLEHLRFLGEWEVCWQIGGTVLLARARPGSGQGVGE
jgi:hypothetical protein